MRHSDLRYVLFDTATINYAADHPNYATVVEFMEILHSGASSGLVSCGNRIKRRWRTKREGPDSAVISSTRYRRGEAACEVSFNASSFGLQNHYQAKGPWQLLTQWNIWNTRGRRRASKIVFRRSGWGGKCGRGHKLDDVLPPKR